MYRPGPHVLPALCAALLSFGSAQAAPGERTLTLRYSPPGCPMSSFANVNALTLLVDALKYSDIRTSLGEVMVSGFRRGDRILFPEEDAMRDPERVPSFLRAKGEVEVEVVQESVPYLETMQEVVLQAPGRGATDWLALMERSGRDNPYYASLRRRTGRLVRLRKAEAGAVFALELKGASNEAWHPDPAGYERLFGIPEDVRSPEEAARLYNWTRTWGESARAAAALATPLAEGGVPPLLHLGALSDPGRPAAYNAFCGELVGSLKPKAIVPSNELSLGVQGLFEFAARHKLPYVAANVRPADPKATQQFPRYVIFEVGGLTVGVVGAVSRSEQAALPPGKAKEWIFEDPAFAVRRALGDLRGQLSKPPDVTVVLVADIEGADLYKLRRERADVLLGDFSSRSMFDLREEVWIEGPHGREASDSVSVPLSPRSPTFAVGEVKATFDSGGVLRRLSHSARPVTHDWPTDEAVRRKLAGVWELERDRRLQVLLPDLVGVVERNPGLERLTWGERLLHLGAYRSQKPPMPPVMTDPLWMRLVTNALRKGLSADVAIARNIARRNNIVGPIGRSWVEDWAPVTEDVRLYSFKGSELLELVKRATRQLDGVAPPADLVFASGLNVKERRVNGRAIEPQERYRVAVTGSTVTLEAVSALFEGKVADAKFSRRVSSYQADSAGAELCVQQVVINFLEAIKPAAAREFSAAQLKSIDELFLDQSDLAAPHWSLRAREVALRGAMIRNSGAMGQFSQSRETRASTPNLLQLGLKLDGALVYEGPVHGFELRAKSQYDSIVLGAVNQEQTDDLVLLSELRLNGVQLAVDRSGFRVVPFFQLAFDTEFSPTPNPAAGTFYPHQRLLQQTLGGVAYPGSWIREARLGILVQEDLSELRGAGQVHVDWGPTAGLKLRIPLHERLTLESDLELRYFVEGGDRPSDLALRLQSINRLLFPITKELSFSLFADLFALSGQRGDGLQGVGANAIFGAGIQFSDFIRL